jgi:trans-aconitate 2-methyltransferase
MGASRKDIVNFYDNYTQKQKRTGINIRHRTILKNLKDQGLSNTSKILEIGCGIGTVTRLIAKYASGGKVVAVDISPQSIEAARELHRDLSNVEFVVSDMSDFSHALRFDFVVLPDVLEHIPVEQHKALFATLKKCVHAGSTILINIPDPHYLRWVHKNRPDLLQIIDQPLATNELLDAVYPSGFYLHSLNTYSLGILEGDYQSIVLKAERELEATTPKPKLSRIIQEIKSRLFY